MALSPLDELRLELDFNCCQVVLTKKKAEAILALIERGMTFDFIWNGEKIGSVDRAAEDFIHQLRKVVGID